MFRDILLGGFLGSIFTVFISKIFDLIQKGKEQKYYSQRIFFEKKLQSANDVVEQLYITANYLDALSELLKFVFKTEKKSDLKIFSEFNKLVIGKFKEINNITNRMANSLFLYFDIGKEHLFLSSETFRNFIEGISSVETLSNQANNALNDYNKCTEKEKKDIAWKRSEDAMKKYRLKVEELADMFGELKDEIFKLIRKLREEMKKFEVYSSSNLNIFKFIKKTIGDGEE